MLAVAVEFLFDGRYYARDTADEEVPEWPPHPARLFAAMVSAAAETRCLERFRPVLRWLEGLEPPPDIAASTEPLPRMPWPNRRRLAAAPEVFVRINDPENKNGSQAHPIPMFRGLQKRFFPSVRAQESTIVFVWPQAELNGEQRGHMEDLCSRIGYLGSSRSKVRVVLADSPPSITWKYDPSGSEYLRIPRPGTLKELEGIFEVMTEESNKPRNRHYPVAGTEAGYRRLVGETGKEPPDQASVFSSFFIFELRGPRLHLESTLFLTQTVRAELLRGAGGEPVPSIHGHHGGDHLALVPLPFVGALHADGAIKGVGAMIPAGLAFEERDKVLFRLAGLSSFEDPNLGRWTLAEPDRRKKVISTLQRERWMGTAQGSKYWATVTPYVFDRYPKAKEHPADIIAASCERIGIGRPSRVSVSEHSPLEGVPRSFDFQMRRPGKPLSKPYAHLTLTFPHRVRGPVLIGEKRHFGLGLCLPVEREMVPSAATIYELA
jgi:CRISPR-associated protein Csb2